MERQLSYDKRIGKTLGGERIDYGLVCGNEKIVFIKTGADGSIRGYRDKYLKMAHRIHNRLGATVICASNPDADSEQVTADQTMICQVAKELGFARFMVYLVGVSDGGYHNLLLAQKVSETVKLLGINTSLIDEEDLAEKLREIPQIEKILVYGTEDYDFACVSMLQEMEGKNVKVVTVDGADHEFTGMVDAFVALIDML